MVDFHTHSNFSDGDLPPDMLIKEAINQGLKAIALTDHDTINGLESAKNAAKKYSEENKNIHFIPGIEININWTGIKSGINQIAPGLGPGGEFHLLGLGIKSSTPAFLAAVEGLSRRREERNRKILDKMHEHSIDVTWDDLVSMSGSGQSLGRPHFAALLIKRKVVKNVNQAFARYLGVGKLFYEPKDGLSFEEAVALIKESGGIPVLAHPISLFIAWGRLPDLIKTLKDMGLMGLEAWHPTAKQGPCRRLEALAQSLGLYVTEGSDFHGSLRPERRMGYSSKGRKISDAILEAIPELL
ncbi:MAG: PHP domain-containing protein [Treponema sp.]|nr:PHP domain-containing protein [Treponema sp.]